MWIKEPNPELHLFDKAETRPLEMFDLFPNFSDSVQGIKAKIMLTHLVER